MHTNNQYQSIVIHPIVVEIFLFEPKWCTDQHPNLLSHAANIVQNVFRGSFQFQNSLCPGRYNLCGANKDCLLGRKPVSDLPINMEIYDHGLPLPLTKKLLLHNPNPTFTVKTVSDLLCHIWHCQFPCVNIKCCVNTKASSNALNKVNAV